MSKHIVIIAIGAAAAAGAYALAVFGRGAVAGQLAADLGDQPAADVASSLSFVEAMLAGARAAVGQKPWTKTEDIYVVS